MEKRVELMIKYLGEQRNFTKTMFKISGTLYRGVTRGRFTYEEGIEAMYKLGGTN